MSEWNNRGILRALLVPAIAGWLAAGCATSDSGRGTGDSYIDQFLSENTGNTGSVQTDGLDGLDADLGVNQPTTLAVTPPAMPARVETVQPAVRPPPLIVKPATPAQPTIRQVKLVAPTPRNLAVAPRAAPRATVVAAKSSDDEMVGGLRGKAPTEDMLLAAPMESGESEKPLLDLPDLPADDLLVRPNEEGVGAGERGVTIQPDTVLWVSVEEDPSLNGKYLVNEYSAIDFGYVGLVLLNDMNVDSAAMKLRGILESRYLKKATVGVKLAKASYDRVGVGGAVLNPGMLKIGPGSTISLNDALRRAGGLRLEATEARVKVIKNGLLSPFGPIAEGTIYPLVDEEGKPTIPRIDLSNSDLVYVFTRQTSTASVGEKRILLLGEVSRPGFVQFNGNEPCTLMHLLFKIGGLTKFAKTDGIRIIRRDKNGRETEIQADAKNLLREGNPDDDIMLENDDRIIVPTRGIKFF